MDKEYQELYKQRLSELTEEEWQQRNLMLKQLQDGRMQGPPVGLDTIDKPWLKYYEDEDLYKAIPNMSVYDMFMENTKDYEDLMALQYFNVKITFREFKQKIEETKRALINMGVKTGDTVSVCLPSIPEVGYTFYALRALGVTANMLDPRTNPSTLCNCVDDSNSNLLICLDSVISSFKDCHAKNIVSVSAINSLPLAIRSVIPIFDKTMRVKTPDDDRIIKYSTYMKGARNVTGKLEKVVVDPDAPAVIAYTGGTTGVSKGVTMTDRALCSMVIENDAMHYNSQPGDTALGMAPPWTFYGLSNSFNTYLNMGIGIKLIPKFGPDELGKIVAKNRPNHIMTVPSALVGLMNEESLKNADLSFIKTVIVGADKLGVQLEEEFNNFLASHNCTARVSKGYGMTEVCAAAVYTKDEVNEPGTVGIPFIFENVGIFNPEDHNMELPEGEVGEICIIGPKNMIGYFGSNADKTSDVLIEHSDGSQVAHTGDLGYMKDGKLYIVGRMKRMFVKAGFKIFPGEIENQVLKHPDVELAAVVAVDNESMGNVISGYVTLKKDCNRNPDDVINEIYKILSDNIFDYELPDSIKVIDHMPLTGMQKVDFKSLEARASQEIESVNLKKI